MKNAVVRASVTLYSTRNYNKLMRFRIKQRCGETISFPPCYPFSKFSGQLNFFLDLLLPFTTNLFTWNNLCNTLDKKRSSHFFFIKSIGLFYWHHQKVLFLMRIFRGYVFKLEVSTRLKNYFLCLYESGLLCLSKITICY